MPTRAVLSARSHIWYGKKKRKKKKNETSVSANCSCGNEPSLKKPVRGRRLKTQRARSNPGAFRIQLINYHDHMSIIVIFRDHLQLDSLKCAPKRVFYFKLVSCLHAWQPQRQTSSGANLYFVCWDYGCLSYGSSGLEDFIWLLPPTETFDIGLFARRFPSSKLMSARSPSTAALFGSFYFFS